MCICSNMAFQHNVCWEEIDGAGRQLKGDHRARWDLSFPEWRFPGLHWFLNSHVYLPASTTLLEPHKVSLTLSPAMETHLGRENPCMDVIQGAFPFLFNTSSNYGLQFCVQNIWSLRTVRKSKSFVNLRLEEGRQQLQVLGFGLRGVPTQIVPKRKEAFGDAARPIGYLPASLEFMIYGAWNFSHQKQIPPDPKQKS